MDLVAVTRYFSAGPAGLPPLCDLFDAVRMARDDHDQELAVPRRQSIQEQLFLAFPRAREQQNRASERGAPGAAGGDLRGVGVDVELEVAGHFDVARAERAQALGVGGALRAHRSQGGKRRPRESTPERIAARRLLR